MHMTEQQHIVFSTSANDSLNSYLAQTDYDHLFVVCDENTEKHCLPIIADTLSTYRATIITVPAGDENKTIETATAIWQQLVHGKATRHSLLINLGGGMITDLGGFAAATFKRGMEFINLPTTLLAIVDASVGGKTGINFCGLKNAIGSFAQAQQTIIDNAFLRTLTSDDILSGFAEMIKHSLLDNLEHWKTILSYDVITTSAPLPSLLFNGEGHMSEKFSDLLKLSLMVKHRFVDKDPNEKNIRKALNLGHTIGHAIETWSHDSHRPLPHGFCVAHGLVGTLYLSCIKSGFPTDRMQQTAAFIRNIYQRPNITCNDYQQLLSLMHHDKKNKANETRFTLLSNIGAPEININIEDKLIEEALDFIREG